MVRFLVCYLFVLSAAISCNSHGVPVRTGVLCPVMDSLLSNYIDKNPKYDVYYLCFYKIGRANAFTIYGDIAYDKYMTDGYFFKNGKLVCYCFMDMGIRDSLVFVENTHIFKDTINGYPEVLSMPLSNFFPKPLGYVALSDMEIKPIEMVDTNMLCEALATDSNAVLGKNLNRTLNNYINNNVGLATHMIFEETGERHFVAFRKINYYDRENINAFFYRNGHIVIIYNMSNTFGSTLIKENEITIFRDSVPGIRYKPIPYKYFMYPNTEKYEILSDGRLKKINLQILNRLVYE